MVDDIVNNTDKYFSYTKEIVKKYGDKKVVYAVFVRKPAIYACEFAISWLKSLNLKIEIEENFKEGERVQPGDPLFFLQGDFSSLVELETLLLQKVGLSCLCAWNAYMMASSLKNVSFISMVARHCVNPQMVELAEYGVSVGSNVAKKEGSKAFIGSSTNKCAYLFGNKEGIGTMPHNLIGYANSTLQASKMYWETFKPKTMTILVDYFGKEVSDSIAVCEYFKDLAQSGNLYLRIDTHGARYLEGLDYNKAHDVLEKYTPQALLKYRDKESIDYMLGMGVSVASIFYFREKINEYGFNNVKIVASSGFNLKKCEIMASLKAPIDVIGTGSVIPQLWTDTYATADVISYDNTLSVKVGREYLLKKYISKNGLQQKDYN